MTFFSHIQAYSEPCATLAYTYFFYKQPVYKQLALEWQIPKQLSGLNPFPVSNNINYRLKKSGLFLCNKRKIAVKPTIHQNLAVSKAFWENFKVPDHKYQFQILRMITFLPDIVYLVKLLSNH